MTQNVRIALLAGAALIVFSAAVSSWFFLRSAKPAEESDAQRPRLPLSEIADNLKKSADPAAGFRAYEIERALSDGKLRPEDVDATPLSAFIMPAWWLKQDGLFELNVAILRGRDDPYDIQILHDDELLGTLIAHSSKVTGVDGGLSLHSLHAYLDAQWKPVTVSPAQERRDIATLEEAEVRGLFVQLEKSNPRLTIRVKGNVLPVTVERPPNLGGQQSER